MAIPTYEIYALKYAGPFDRPAPMMNWFQDMDKRIRINYYVFVIRGGGKTIVVDCGCAPALAKERDLVNYVNPAEVLKRIDIIAGEVKYLVVSHIHFDHISGIEMFPQATVFVQEKEFNFWINDPIAKRAPFHHVTDPVGNRYLKNLKGTERLRLIKDDGVISVHPETRNFGQGQGTRRF